ncbi:hypothetical protein GA0074695_0732 [Micromonospora viridifaciens]|uniref:Uncharacterized protein n=1 Tax=Micromonospora viridifaciens TaxID=1881 RepID=A0A1C4UQQ9_MICVI|nr:hypothetical protein [Micromonospora viridifaciens]SCE73995.1 hypothetical protein GA0074695_0732 [Micromonospora viridifaciens]
MDADDRVRGVLLAGLVLAAMGLGAWWWRDSAPALGPQGASPSPSASAFLQADVWLVDPDTGQVTGGPGADPDEAVVVHQGPDQAAVVPRSVWQERAHLVVGQDPLIRQVNPAPGERHLLTASCTGPGTLVVDWSGAEEDDSLTTTCAATPIARPLTASGGPLLVRFTVEDGEVDLDARLSSAF